MSELADYYNIDDGFYRFPDLETAWKYGDDMADDAYFVIQKRADSDLLEKYRKLFGY